MSVWGTLTGRGRLVLIAGAALCLLALTLRERELLWLGAALMAVTILALITVRAARPRESVARSLTNAVAPVGSRIEVALSVRRGRRLLEGVRIYEDDAAAELGGGPRFWLPTVGPARAELAYALHSTRRGRYTVGPLAVDVRDPFGLARMDYAHDRTDTVLATPLVESLPTGLLAGRGSQRGGDSPQRLGTSGDDDTLVREYRHGDSMRRVHWRSSAKVGDLMVRQQEQTWEQAATIVLDTRLDPHAGDGADDSLEWSVSAAASLALLLSESGQRAEILGPHGAIVAASGGQRLEVARREILERLADVRCEETARLTGAAQALGSSPAQLVVAVLAQCSPQDAALLGDALGQRRRGIAIIVATPEFGRPHGPRDVGGESLLLARGWRIAHAHAGQSVAECLSVEAAW